LITFSLQSGSNGNSIYVEAGGTGILFDAGISGRLSARLLDEKGRDIRACKALFLSHDHADHVRCAGIWQRRFGIPVHATEATIRAASGLDGLRDVRLFRAGETVEVGPVKVHTIRTPHDAADGVAFVVDHEGKRLGILTDLGRPFPTLARLLPELDGAYLESNYDPDMLEKGRYPAFLKARIRGGRGHLSNFEAAALARESLGSRLRWIAIAHLSEENNLPELALDIHRQHLGRLFPVHLAWRHGPGPLLEV